MVSVGILMGLIAMFCWGISDFLYSIVTRRLGTLKTTFTSQFLSIIPTLIAILLFFNKLSFDLHNLLYLAIGGLLMVVAVVNFFEALRIGEVALVAPIANAYSVITVILAILFLQESLSTLRLISIVLVILGVILTSTDLRKLKHIHTAKGIVNAFIPMIIWGIYFFIVKYVSNNLSNSMSGVDVAINLFILTGIFNGLFMVSYPIIKKQVPTFAQVRKDNILLMLIIITILVNISWFAINYGVSLDLVSLVTPISSLAPAITVILAVIFFKDKLVLNQKLGIITILLGLFLISV